ncbi:CoA-transferase family III domain-containing protein [Podospora conica]|nr:CoA-transferase family III domain-containing protein [Schizothecium conicum]
MYESTVLANGRLSEWSAEPNLVDKSDNPKPGDEPRLTINYSRVKEKRFVWLAAAKSTGTSDALSALNTWMEMISTLPLATYVDPGSAFISKQFHAAMKKRGIPVINAPAQSHSSVGKVETHNRIIQSMMRKCTGSEDTLRQSFRPGVMASSGFGELSALNPRLVYGSISGYGTSGPLSAMLSNDLALVAGVHLSNAVVAAQFRWERTGVGQQVDVSILDATIAADELQDPRFVDNRVRVTHRAELTEEIAAVTRTWTKAHWVATLAAAVVPVSPVNTLREAFGIPYKYSATHYDVRLAPPRAGKHSVEVLTELLGVTATDVAKLRESGALGAL